MIFTGLFLFFLIQRLSEVMISRGHFQLLKEKLIDPIDPKERGQMVLLHGLWFVSLFIEYYWHGSITESTLFWAGIFVLLLCQLVRLWTMLLLKDSWVPVPIAYRGQEICQTGPYRFIRHPNYLAVLIEIPLLPLLCGCPLTAAFFGAANTLFLSKRIEREEKALIKLSPYQDYKMKTKKILPFLLGLTLTLPVFAEEMKFHHKDYDSANTGTMFKFIGESTKLGLITTSFEGRAKEGILEFERSGETLTDVTLNLPTDKLDTDNSSRNEKMYEKCLETKKYPNLSVMLSKIDLKSEEQTIKAIMHVRDKEVPLEIVIRKKDNTYSGESSFKLTDAGIPDPSIAVASVKDTFTIHFQVEIIP